jgi:threonine/homoserine/homoserine lactone efflux protein
MLLVEGILIGAAYVLPPGPVTAETVRRGMDVFGATLLLYFGVSALRNWKPRPDRYHHCRTARRVTRHRICPLDLGWLWLHADRIRTPAVILAARHPFAYRRRQ